MCGSSSPARLTGLAEARDEALRAARRRGEVRPGFARTPIIRHAEFCAS
jgi:hypothetical protein